MTSKVLQHNQTHPGKWATWFKRKAAVLTLATATILSGSGGGYALFRMLNPPEHSCAHALDFDPSVQNKLRDIYQSTKSHLIQHPELNFDYLFNPICFDSASSDYDARMESYIEARIIFSVLKDRIDLPQNVPTITKSPFYRYAFYPDAMEYFRSHEVFWQAAEIVANHPRVKNTREVRLVYPASSSHLAPLDLFHRLIQKGTIEQARAIYTEIDPKTLTKVRELLHALTLDKVYTELRETTKEFPGGSRETTFYFKYNGRPIQLMFALKRSGEQYYRDEYLEQTDVWIIHDPGTQFMMSSGMFGSSPLLPSYLKLLQTDSHITNPPIIIMEDDNSGYKEFPGAKVTIIPSPYGHRSWIKIAGQEVREAGRPDYWSAVVLQPELDFWRNYSWK